jgi:hypothetical protein
MSPLAKQSLRSEIERFPNLGNIAEFRLLCTNGNKHGLSGNRILKSEHRPGKTRSISQLSL